jgi:hypothetical protein
MFISNKYLNIYFDIINKAKIRNTTSELVEIHHVIPKSLGGSNKKENLVILTPREHFVCHKILIKITSSENRKKMCYAFWRMCNGSPSNKYNVTSQQYENARQMFINSRKAHEQSLETKLKRSNSAKGKKRPWSKENIKKYNDKIKNGQKINHCLKRWKIVDPCGNIHIVDNLAEFCRIKKLSQGNFTVYGKSKGYSVTCLGFVKDLELIN